MAILKYIIMNADGTYDLTVDCDNTEIVVKCRGTLSIGKINDRLASMRGHPVNLSFRNSIINPNIRVFEIKCPA